MAAALPGALVPLTEDPSRAGVFLDYDGTLAPIVPDPAQALPFSGVCDLLGRLGRRYGIVAVVSGRPARFLCRVLGPPPGVALFGLYGMEQAARDTGVRTAPAAEGWRPVIEEALGRARAAAPTGVRVEGKGLTVTLHWREHPEGETWARRFAAQEARRAGLVPQDGRRSVELRPPVEVDKGTVVAEQGAGCRAVTYMGDDVGDLPAFAALDALAATGVAVAKVAVSDPEGPAELRAAADVVVGGPDGVAALLDALAGSAPPLKD